MMICDDFCVPLYSFPCRFSLTHPPLSSSQLSFRRFSLTQLKKGSPSNLGPNRRLFRGLAKLARMTTLKTFELSNISVGDSFPMVLLNGSYSGMYQRSPRRRAKGEDGDYGSHSLLWSEQNPFLQEQKRSRFARRVEVFQLDNCDLGVDSALAIGWFILGALAVSQDDIHAVQHHLLADPGRSKTFQSLGFSPKSSHPMGSAQDEISLGSPVDNSEARQGFVRMTLPSTGSYGPSPCDMPMQVPMHIHPSTCSAVSHCTVLRLANNQLGFQGASVICQALKFNASLRVLDLSKNMISHHIGRPLSELLRVNSTLQSLILFGNTVENWGVSRIAEGLLNNQSLLELNLKNNSIFSNGALKLSQALKLNTTLKKCDLSWNKIKDDGSGYLSEMLEINHSLEELSLEWNPLLDVGVTRLAEAIGNNPNTKLRVLNLGWTRVNHVSLEAGVHEGE